MSKENFEFILNKITPLIEKEDTNMRKAISAAERLSITMRFLVTGDSYHSLAFLYRVSPSTISKIVPEVCEAIYHTLKDDFLKFPNNKQEWMVIAEEYKSLWNFPHCVGSLDGKHINIIAPAKSGSSFFNYKGYHSIVLMALADARYKFTYVDVGGCGRISDGGIFNNSTLSRAMENERLMLPNPTPLVVGEEPIPYVFVADDAFALRPNIMKLYNTRNLDGPERIFNYRLSRARRIVENAFGLLVAKFRILNKKIHLDEHKTKMVVLAICVLHNMLIERENQYIGYQDVDIDLENGTIIPGNWRNQIRDPLSFENDTHYTHDAKHIQTQFKNYFVSPEGEVPWQYLYI